MHAPGERELHTPHVSPFRSVYVSPQPVRVTPAKVKGSVKGTKKKVKVKKKGGFGGK